MFKRVGADQLDPRTPAPVISLKDDDRVAAAFCAVDVADVAAVVTDRTVAGVGTSGGPVALAEAVGRNDPGSPPARPVRSLAAVAR